MEDKVLVGDLFLMLLSSWDWSTADGEWVVEYPMMGQGLVTALVVQDYLGGSIYLSKTGNPGGTYLNKLDDIGYINLASCGGWDEPDGAEALVPIDRGEVLEDDKVFARYTILKERVAALISDDTDKLCATCTLLFGHTDDSIVCPRESTDLCLVERAQIYKGAVGRARKKTFNKVAEDVLSEISELMEGLASK